MRTIRSIVAVIALSAATSCDPSTDPDRSHEASREPQVVTAVVLKPVPEGQVLEYSDGPDAAASLDAVREAIPSPLPDPIEQDCEQGGNVVVHLEDGSAVSYGPCQLPSSIEELKQEIMTAEAERQADCGSPDEGPVPRRAPLIERARIYAAALREAVRAQPIYLRAEIFKGNLGGKGTWRPMSPALQTLIAEEFGNRRVQLCHGDIGPWGHSVASLGAIDRDGDRASVGVDVLKSGGCTYQLRQDDREWRVEGQGDCYNY